MRTFKFLVATVLFLGLSIRLCADDKKKRMIVESGQPTHQVTNHPHSYTTQGHANTNCTGSGTVNGTATDTGYGTTNVNGTVNTDSNCNTTYTPSRTVNGNRVTVNNAAWVHDVATGDGYLIECTANWVASKCSYLLGGRYAAELEGNNMWITGMKGMKESKAKYRVVQFVPGLGTSPAESASPSSQSNVSLSPDENYAWETYGNLGPADKEYVRVFCGSNPKSAALLPRAKVDAGQSADHSLDCEAWSSAKGKTK